MATPLKRHACLRERSEAEESAENVSGEEENADDENSDDENDDVVNNDDDDDDPDSQYVPFIQSDDESETGSNKDKDASEVGDGQVDNVHGEKDDGEVDDDGFAEVLINFAKIFLSKGPFTPEQIKEKMPRSLKGNWYVKEFSNF